MQPLPRTLEAGLGTLEAGQWAGEAAVTVAAATVAGTGASRLTVVGTGASM